MPRRDRRDGQGAIHHVMNRGVARRTIFHDDADKRTFLARVAWEVARGRLALHAFALLDNHFHLLVVSLTGELSTAMKRIEARYVRRFNRRAGRDGPLFRGRFKSIPVEDDGYWTLLFDYIEQNPVHAGLVKHAADYRFGSAHYRALPKRPRWLAPSRGGDHASPGSTEADADRSWLVERTLSLSEPDAVRWPDPGLNAPLRSWILERSRPVDGQRAVVPAAAPRGVLRVVDGLSSATPKWTVRLNRRAQAAWPILRTGLLKSLCGLGYQEIALTLRISATCAHNAAKNHRHLLIRNDEYRARCVAAATEILNGIRPRAASPRPSAETHDRL